MLIIDKPSLVAEPPELPPYLRKKRKGEPERRVIIVPDIRFMSDGHPVINDYENNWKTTVYSWMNRITGEGGIFDSSSRWEVAHAHSRIYRQWLETYDLTSRQGIPPHISFSGCITPGEGDPTFYPRWQEWARGYFC